MGRGGNEQRAEEAVDIRVVANDKHVFAVAKLVNEMLEVVQAGFRGKCTGEQDLGLVTSLRADEGGGLHASLEIAGDNDVELDLQRIQDMSKLQAVALSVFIERAFEIEERVSAAGSGAGMTKNKQVHRSCFHFSLLSAAVFHREGGMNRGTLLRAGQGWLSGIVVEDSGIGFLKRGRDGLRIGNRVGGVVRNGILTFATHKK